MHKTNSDGTGFSGRHLHFKLWMHSMCVAAKGMFAEPPPPAAAHKKFCSALNVRYKMPNNSKSDSGAFRRQACDQVWLIENHSNQCLFTWYGTVQKIYEALKYTCGYCLYAAACVAMCMAAPRRCTCSQIDRRLIASHCMHAQSDLYGPPPTCFEAAA